MIELIEGGVTSPKGFRAAGVAAGIKKSGSDMAMIASDQLCVCAGTFTSNVVKAAPVMWDKAVIESGGKAGAVVVNSGVANACTGQEGMDKCRREAECAALALGLACDQVFVASTGVIGAQLPMDRIIDGIGKLSGMLSDSQASGTQAAKAIMTTDTRKKEAAVSFEIDGKKVVIGGMSKGSGMIHPNMCTMLAFLTTDANIGKDALTQALRSSVERSFNRISVDGDTSTNDTCLLMANGMAGCREITCQSREFELFQEALDTLTVSLARQMAADGEGAGALIEAEVKGCRTEADAVRLAKSVITSSLVKTAVAGHDANWGRILCALGYAGVDFDPQKTDLFIRGQQKEMQIVRNGVSTGYSEEEATSILSEKEIRIIADLKEGEESAVCWGCDLTCDYVRINADYRS